MSVWCATLFGLTGDATGDTQRRSSEIPPRGDLYMAITAAAAVAAVLIGLGLASAPPNSAQTPAAAPAPACSSLPGSC
ncbi:hypothetical protein ACFYZ2_16760 [Streptomyces sviceus]|uniref:hypothetical protein n=1 Tax=Streptomyces sviceus TaxID=285530 RepID=UPI0036B180E5